MKNNIRKCKLCEKEMGVERAKIGRSGSNMNSKQRLTSKEGVFVTKWMCNGCWDKLFGNVIERISFPSKKFVESQRSHNESTDFDIISCRIK